jgi:lipopolysaccharide transport system permease protein
MNMFSGIIAYNIFSESISRAPLLIVQNANFVKKVVFPLEVLPVSLVGSALIHSVLSLVILLVGSISGAGSVHWTLALLPIVVLPLAIFSAGVCWLLSSLGVFLRDIGNVVQVLVSLLFFLTPITYSPEQVPDKLRPLMRFNLLAPMIDNFRRVVNEGKSPDWASYFVTLGVSILVAMAGYAWFMKIKRAFADVI